MKVKKIKKETAWFAFNAGFSIVLMPSKCKSLWVYGLSVSKKIQNIEFDKIVYFFECNYCDAERGRRPAYYIDVNDWVKYIKR